MPLNTEMEDFHGIIVNYYRRKYHGYKRKDHQRILYHVDEQEL